MPRNILILEDDNELLLLYNRTLTKAGYRVYLARSISTARERLQAYDIDLFICDLHVDDVLSIQHLRDELAVLRQKQIPVVVISGHSEMKEECEQRGFAFALKPITPRELPGLVGYALNAT